MVKINPKKYRVRCLKSWDNRIVLEEWIKRTEHYVDFMLCERTYPAIYNWSILDVSEPWTPEESVLLSEREAQDSLSTN